MRFLIILVACFLRRQMDRRRQGDLEPGLRRLIARIPARGLGSGLALWALGLLVLLCLLLGIADFYAMRGPWFAFWLLVELLLLVGALGNPGWHDSLRAYTHAWQRRDSQAAWHHVRHLLPSSRQGLATTPEKLHLILASRLLMSTFEGYFLVVFWFALLGPAGAVLVRLAMAMRDHWPQPVGRLPFQTLFRWLAWAPAHLLSMTFAMAGDFNGWLMRHRGDSVNPMVGMGAGPIESSLYLGANGALSSYSLQPDRFASQHPDDWPDYARRSLSAVRDLLNRSMLVWIGFLALLAIAGWP